jgi:hypothetical protein
MNKNWTADEINDVIEMLKIEIARVERVLDTHPTPADRGLLAGLRAMKFKLEGVVAYLAQP